MSKVDERTIHVALPLWTARALALMTKCIHAAELDDKFKEVEKLARATYMDHFKNSRTVSELALYAAAVLIILDRNIEEVEKLCQTDPKPN
jgi:hypothetical protein